MSGGTITYNDAITSLMSMFPHFDKEIVDALLRQNREGSALRDNLSDCTALLTTGFTIRYCLAGGAMEPTIELLLAMDAPSAPAPCVRWLLQGARLSAHPRVSVPLNTCRHVSPLNLPHDAVYQLELLAQPICQVRMQPQMRGARHSPAAEAQTDPHALALRRHPPLTLMQALLPAWRRRRVWHHPLACAVLNSVHKPACFLVAPRRFR